MTLIAAAQKVKRWTAEDYLDFEFKSKIRNELINGKLIPRPYTSPNHGRIVFNISGILYNFFIDKISEVFTESRMIYSKVCEDFYYPDVVITDGKPLHEKHKNNMLITTNPSVLIEVLSSSTEIKDRREKLPCYQAIPSLNQYILVSQNETRAEIYEKDGKKWIYKNYQNSEDIIKVDGLEITLKDIYQKVDFEISEIEED